VLAGERRSPACPQTASSLYAYRSWSESDTVPRAGRFMNRPYEPRTVGAIACVAHLPGRTPGEGCSVYPATMLFAFTRPMTLPEGSAN
jgi:hypothetical protein